MARIYEAFISVCVKKVIVRDKEYNFVLKLKVLDISVALSLLMTKTYI
jgi:hypothetical protein